MCSIKTVRLYRMSLSCVRLRLCPIETIVCLFQLVSNWNRVRLILCPIETLMCQLDWDSLFQLVPDCFCYVPFLVIFIEYISDWHILQSPFYFVRIWDFSSGNDSLLWNFFSSIYETSIKTSIWNVYMKRLFMKLL